MITISISVQGQILPFASILKNYKSYKSTQWEQRARSDPSPLVPIHKPVGKQTAYASLYWNNVNQNNHQFLLR